jgi:Mg/Co/Ni transporter MgtE
MISEKMVKFWLLFILILAGCSERVIDDMEHTLEDVKNVEEDLSE